jgi:hypothetical protein
VNTPVSALVTFTLEPYAVNGGRDVYWVRQTDKMLVVEYVAGYVDNAFGDVPAVNLTVVLSGQTVRSAGDWPMEMSPHNVFQQKTTIFVEPRHVLFMRAARQNQSSYPTHYTLSIAGYLVDVP